MEAFKVKYTVGAVLYCVRENPRLQQGWEDREQDLKRGVTFLRGQINKVVYTEYLKGYHKNNIKYRLKLWSSSLMPFREKGRTIIWRNTEVMYYNVRTKVKGACMAEG